MTQTPINQREAAAREKDKIAREVDKGGKEEQKGETGPTPSNWSASKAAKRGRIRGEALLGVMLLATCTTVCKLEYDARTNTTTRIVAAFREVRPLRTEISHTIAKRATANNRSTPITYPSVAPIYAVAESVIGQAVHFPPVDKS